MLHISLNGVSLTDDALNQRLDHIEAALARIEYLVAVVDHTLVTQGGHMSKELDNLTAQVATATTIEQSAIALIQGLAAQIAAAANDPVAINALADQLSAESTALAAAVQANTPAAP